MSQIFLQKDYNRSMRRLVQYKVGIDFNDTIYEKMREKTAIVFYEYYNFYNPDSCCYNHAYPDKDVIITEMKSIDMYDKYITKMQVTVDFYINDKNKLKKLLGARS